MVAGKNSGLAVKSPEHDRRVCCSPSSGRGECAAHNACPCSSHCTIRAFRSVPLSSSPATNFRSLSVFEEHHDGVGPSERADRVLGVIGRARSEKSRCWPAAMLKVCERNGSSRRVVRVLDLRIEAASPARCRAATGLSAAGECRVSWYCGWLGDQPAGKCVVHDRVRDPRRSPRPPTACSLRRMLWKVWLCGQLLGGPPK